MQSCLSKCVLQLFEDLIAELLKVQSSIVSVWVGSDFHIDH